MTQTVCALTTRLFRCPGVRPPAPQLDAPGWHDAAFWLVLVCLGAGWFFFFFEPQRTKNGLLEGRQQVLEARVKAETLELARLRQEGWLLRRGDAQAWERAARGRLGWVKPGEVLNLETWRHEAALAGRPDPLTVPVPANTPAPPGRSPAVRPAGPAPRPVVAERGAAASSPPRPPAVERSLSAPPSPRRAAPVPAFVGERNGDAF